MHVIYLMYQLELFCLAVFFIDILNKMLYEKLMLIRNQRTNGPVNAHLISEQILSTKPGYKLLKDFSVQAFIFISESFLAKGTTYTLISSLRLIYQPISRPHAAKIPIIVAFSCKKPKLQNLTFKRIGQGHPRVTM